jgi:small subunit ribosomal protein S16
MALKIRLRQQGRNNCQTYRMVVTDVRSPRDGKYIEMIGWYQPAEDENNLHVEAERVSHWLKHGAQMTHHAEALIAKAAPEVLKEYRKHKEAKRVKQAAKRRALKAS